MAPSLKISGDSTDLLLAITAQQAAYWSLYETLKGPDAAWRRYSKVARDGQIEQLRRVSALELSLIRAYNEARPSAEGFREIASTFAHFTKCAKPDLQRISDAIEDEQAWRDRELPALLRPQAE